MRTLYLFISLIAAAPSVGAADEPLPPAAAAVRAEALHANQAADGRPLPLAAQWHVAHMPLDYQIALIRGGHHILPFIAWPSPEGDPARKASKKPAATRPSIDAGMRQLAAWDMPFAVMGTQWEAVLADHLKKWRMMPPAQSALVWSATATAATTKPTLKMLSPFGAIAPWEEAGRYWTDNAGMKNLQALYPNPPLVLMVSNNEAEKLRWHDVDKDKRYLDAYGTDKSDDFKRKVVSEGWIERYRALFAGMRNALASEAWKKNIRFLGYNAFGPDNFGNGNGWKKYATTTEEQVSWTWHAWDGGIPEAYDNGWQRAKTAFSLWSCQTEKFNSVFMKDEALKANPNFWLEIVFWDGHSGPAGEIEDAKIAGKAAGQDKYLRYEQLGVRYTPELYRGWVQYVMWTVQPRVAREWRSSADHPRDNWWPRFSQIILTVDLVHADPVLTRFWREGQLVPNRAHGHPFNHEIPQKWKDVDRWFALDTSVDPPRPWELTTRLPVFALARVIGAKPAREWLLYAHAPLGDKKAVEIAIPEYEKVTVDVSVGGSFYHIKESDKSVQSVGDISKIPVAPL